MFHLEERIKNAKTLRGRNAMKDRLPKEIENSKKIILIRGTNASPVVRECLMDLLHIHGRDLAVPQLRKNDFLPFDDITPFERLSVKWDASLFAYVSHNKKRPHNLVIGRMYNFNLLDMVELGLENYQSLSSIKGPKFDSGRKPCLVFSGDFESDPVHDRLRNLLIDIFRGVSPPFLCLEGFEVAYFFIVDEGKVHFQGYRINLCASGGRKPLVNLTPMGPKGTFVIRRSRLASKELLTESCQKRSKAKAQERTSKNISKDAFGTTQARVHMTKQAYEELHTRSFKAFTQEKKKQNKEQNQNEDNTDNAEIDMNDEYDNEIDNDGNAEFEDNDNEEFEEDRFGHTRDSSGGEEDMGEFDEEDFE